MSRFSPSDWLRNARHFAQFVVTSFLCHSLHPMSHCMRTAPARSSKEMDLGLLLHHVGSTFLLGPIRTLRQNFWIHKYTEVVLNVKVVCQHNVHGIEIQIPSTSGDNQFGLVISMSYDSGNQNYLSEEVAPECVQHQEKEHSQGERSEDQIPPVSQ